MKSLKKKKIVTVTVMYAAKLACTKFNNRDIAIFTCHCCSLPEC